jgi:hypothetical protein
MRPPSSDLPPDGSGFTGYHPKGAGCSDGTVQRVAVGMPVLYRVDIGYLWLSLPSLVQWASGGSEPAVSWPGGSGSEGSSLILSQHGIWPL